MSTLYSVGQMNQLGDALELADFTPTDVANLRSSGLLSNVRRVLRGYAEIKLNEYVIDCDADPVELDGWTVVRHVKGGRYVWNPHRIILYVSPKRAVTGHQLREDLQVVPVLNVCVLDFLLAHPALIPQEWKGKFVCFYGTVYRNAGGRREVRNLFWDGERWYSEFIPLDFLVQDNLPVAVLG
ncbi:MAG: hypothetical protein A3B24_01200 [Candidatus Wildermuthbacteria bacterium RIFCSPLOWO2_01_FULL_48_16]|uniref:Uncharacterized protein n=1 Tax=Candidatus Wildermuthbacteria bacterium RIFCSPLOWO2_01_FULL_48_16 TaxID=1802461 RepID=A0A1G2RJJ0_9BACT|nr:MAG: hypothetical protein A3J57_02080 [Candidatus Wildermuthbacteria bacterium RIFCSPHIGHO2_02_FULL_49_12b]OHA73013.1 MAG: hypothetical protein A3B24_01200 [Candidatus Wildermuthbacteria bacterium RIFCSPLOWO2_01_FULL_48_16]